MAYSDPHALLIAQNYDASYAVSRDPSGDARFYRERWTAGGETIVLARFSGADC